MNAVNALRRMNAVNALKTMNAMNAVNAVQCSGGACLGGSAGVGGEGGGAKMTFQGCQQDHIKTYHFGHMGGLWTHIML